MSIIGGGVFLTLGTVGLMAAQALLHQNIRSVWGWMFLSFGAVGALVGGSLMLFGQATLGRPRKAWTRDDVVRDLQESPATFVRSETLAPPRLAEGVPESADPK